MNIRDILTNILIVANYPVDKRESFVKTFYEYLTVKLITSLKQADPEVYQKLVDAFGESSEHVSSGLHEAYKNPLLKEKIDLAISEVVAELANDIALGATEEQKEKIINSISNF